MVQRLSNNNNNYNLMSSIQHQLRLLTAEIALSTLESRVYLRLIGICGESSEAEAEKKNKTIYISKFILSFAMIT